MLLSLFSFGCDTLLPPPTDADRTTPPPSAITQKPTVKVPKAANAALGYLSRLAHDYDVDDCWVLTSKDYPKDVDRDGLFDSCEYDVAKQLSPTLHYDSTDWSSLPDARRSFWATAPSSKGIKTFYALGYFKDRGYTGLGISQHEGDSEFITVGIVMNDDGGFSHVRTCASAHTKAGNEIACKNDDKHSLDIWVAKRKHANFFSKSDCDDGAFWLDSCDDADSKVKFVADSIRNMGSSLDHMVNCVRIKNKKRTDKECLWTDSKFDGWRKGYDGDAATGYGFFLRDHFPHILYSERPKGTFTMECKGSKCSFDASASTDDFEIVRYEWLVLARKWGAPPVPPLQEVAHMDTVPTWSYDFDVTEQVTLWVEFVARDYHSRSSDRVIKKAILNCVKDCDTW